MAQLSKVYDPKAVEERLYQAWEESGVFHAEPDPAKKPFTIVMPPPNITGQLHMGHALDNTMQDILIRFKRMCGYNALWVPGTDHASIATEVKVTQKLAAEGIDKHAIGREEFLKHVWAWKEQYGSRIVTQLKKLGGSCDWARERFTMDAGCSRAVTKVFVDLYEKGLIYRGDRIINRCPKCNTALSDAEVEYEEQDSHLWHIRYPLADGSGRAVVVATTRPETMLGDTAVAVNTTDERYADIVGAQVVLPLTGRTIPVIADDYVEKEFGTGAVKITPAHDPNDFEVGLRHGLAMPRAIADDGTMTDLVPAYAGLDRMECRRRLVDDLEAAGYLVKVEPYKHNVGTCYRCHTTVEPLLSKQWFVKMKPLAEPAIEAVRSGETRFVPDRFEKTYFNWMENVRDWCISRQLWWGHRIPAYYCDSCGHTVVAAEAPAVCPACGHAHLTQDEDVLDTWFSSALWPFSTLGWPDKTPELAHFYPTSVLVTGYDIIFFWVARMIFSGIEHMGRAPFADVLIHGLVRDGQGRKMSKSLGNGVEPLEVVEKYGADALRFSLTVGVSPGNDMRYKDEKVEAARNFANKLWNAARFVLLAAESTPVAESAELKLDPADKWILSRLSAVTAEATENLEKYELGIAAQKIYDFIWSEFCDWYIELTKPRLYGTDEEARRTAVTVLVRVLNAAVRLLHPFMPFITEEIYQSLPDRDGSIVTAAWPKPDDVSAYAADAETMEAIMDVIRALRNTRAEKNVPPSKRVSCYVKSPLFDAISAHSAYLARLAGVEKVCPWEKQDNAVSVVTPHAEISVPLAELVDLGAEKARLSAELTRLTGEIARAEAKLSNPGFTGKAPAAVVEAERAKLTRYTEMKDKIEAQLARL
ncbi:MAG: valine--tRNA ligase [Eubacteriales bacterium]|nr:valine--tRNA ligase [Eubacteriales bacterium]